MWRLVLVVLLAFVTPLEARVLRTEVLDVKPAFEGTGFGDVGPYERVSARVTIGVSPGDRRNAGIHHIQVAPRNAAGLVEATADVLILRPTDPARGNGTLLYDVVNRGAPRALQLFNDVMADPAFARVADAGTGYLMRQGYTLVFSGWQFDVPRGGSGLTIQVPVAAGVTGPSREEFIWATAPATTPGALTHPAATREGTLTVRAKESDPRQTPADMSFSFVDDRRIEIKRPAGFDAGAIYEFTYTAKDPAVGGLGFAAIRDIVSHLRHDRADPAGAESPLARGGRLEIQRAYAFGQSQSGRVLRDLLYQGFNEDEAGRAVFEALMPWVAGARLTYLNAAFAQPGRYSRQHEDRLYPNDQFPFTYGVSADKLTGKTDGVMAKCLATNTCPKIYHVDSDAEFFQARAALIVTDTDGNPIDLPANVRAYSLSGMPHAARPGMVSEPLKEAVLPSNPLSPGPTMRALLATLDQWVREGREPPSSRFPSLASGTLVPLGTDMFPATPDMPYRGIPNIVTVVDHSQNPPVPGRAYPLFIPLLDSDGHAVAGIKQPAVSVPRATYVGWNPRRPGFGEGQMFSTLGGAIKLPATEADRVGDSRKSIAARYPTQDAYVAAVAKAADSLVAQRLMLPEDAALQVAEAKAGKLSGMGN